MVLFLNVKSFINIVLKCVENMWP